MRISTASKNTHTIFNKNNDIQQSREKVATTLIHKSAETQKSSQKQKLKSRSLEMFA